VKEWSINSFHIFNYFFKLFRWVITAAHCHKKVPRTWTLFQVRLGDWDIRQDPDCEDLANERVCNDPYVEVPVSQIIVHEEYLPDSRQQHHDIALLKLQRDVRFTDFIKPVCMPTETNLRSLDYTGQTLEVVGFGKTENTNSSPRKLKVDIDAYSFDACQSKYASLGIIRGQVR
jgi:Trypsin